MREDVLPRVRADIDYLSRKNIQVISPSGEPLIAEEIDWQHPGSVMLRQVAGVGNPLGRVVVRFPNNDMIYLHDTPARGLFQRDQRALSSGCVRVEGVAELAQMLLQDTGSHYQMSSLLSGGSDRNVSLPQRIPVALHYLTAWPNAQGEVEFRPDIYRRDPTLLLALQRPVETG
jgi:murein L,D-transpeptidase YcbB/YkuD